MKKEDNLPLIPVSLATGFEEFLWHLTVVFDNLTVSVQAEKFAQ
jgi:hypothetical protein